MKQAQVTLESSQDRQLASRILSSHISEKVTQNLSLTLADAISGTISALEVQQTSLNFNSLARVVMSKLITINFLWASQGGVYASANTPCCTYRNTTGQVEQFLMRLKEKATWLLQESSWSLGHVCMGLVVQAPVYRVYCEDKPASCFWQLTVMHVARVSCPEP